MKTLYKYLLYFLLGFVGEIGFPGISFGQEISKLVSKADTSNFSTKQSEWSLLNNYQSIDASKSIVSLEIISVNNTNKADLTQEQYLGRIKESKFQPKRTQYIEYKLLNDIYAIRIEKSGKCYFYLKKGKPLPGESPVFPLFISYRLD
jgi:hypothetical protein